MNEEANLKSWAEQRDAILLDIANKRIEQKNLTDVVNGLSSSISDIQKRIIESNVREEELYKKEREMAQKLSSEVAELQVKKTALENQIPGLEKEVELLSANGDNLEHRIATLMELHDRVFFRTTQLDTVVDHVVKINQKNDADVNIMLSNLKKAIQDIVDISEKTIHNANLVSEKLPQTFFDLQKQYLTRKTKYDIPR
jgi:chromosome segregation ATPase